MTQNMNMGIGSSSSAISGANIVVKRDAILQNPNTLEEYAIGKYSARMSEQTF